MPDGTNVYDRAADETRRLEALYRYGVLDSAPEESFDRITRLARTVLQTDIVAVSLIDRDRQWFKSRQGTQLCGSARDISFCTHAIADSVPMIVPDASIDPRFANSPLVTGEPWVRFYLGVPLRTPDGHNIGALCAVDRKPRTPSIEQVAVMQDLALLVIDELELRQLATVDELTGALTRRAFITHGEHAIARAQRNGHSLSLIAFDVDHFKAVNDTHGHPTGDETLRSVAACCQAELRSFDEFGRLGGEEFAVLVPEQDCDGAAAIAERLRKRIASTAVRARGGLLRVTASFGVAQHALHGTMAELMSEADAALYLAKRSGRNQTIQAPPLHVDDEFSSMSSVRPTLRF